MGTSKLWATKMGILGMIWGCRISETGHDATSSKMSEVTFRGHGPRWEGPAIDTGMVPFWIASHATDSQEPRCPQHFPWPASLHCQQLDEKLQHWDSFSIWFKATQRKISGTLWYSLCRNVPNTRCFIRHNIAVRCCEAECCAMVRVVLISRWLWQIAWLSWIWEMQRLQIRMMR